MCENDYDYIIIENGEYKVIKEIRKTACFAELYNRPIITPFTHIRLYIPKSRCPYNSQEVRKYLSIVRAIGLKHNLEEETDKHYKVILELELKAYHITFAALNMLRYLYEEEYNIYPRLLFNIKKDNPEITWMNCVILAHFTKEKDTNKRLGYLGGHTIVPQHSPKFMKVKEFINILTNKNKNIFKFGTHNSLNLNTLITSKGKTSSMRDTLERKIEQKDFSEWN